MRILHAQETLSLRYGGPANVLPQLRGATACRVRRGDRYDQRRLSVRHLPRTGVGHAGVGYRVGVSQFDAVCTATVFGRTSFVPEASYIRLRRCSCAWPLPLSTHIRRLLGTQARGSIHYPAPPFARPVPIKSSRSIRLKRLYERWFDLPNLHAADAIYYTVEDERSLEPCRPGGRSDREVINA